MCLGRSAAARSGSTRSLRGGEGMSDMWREWRAGLCGTWSCLRCWEGAWGKKVWKDAVVAHDYLLYLPAVAAAMLALLPSPTTQGIVLCSPLPPKIFQLRLYRSCLSHISSSIHQAFASPNVSTAVFLCAHVGSWVSQGLRTWWYIQLELR